jgi:hypothetical protein
MKDTLVITPTLGSRISLLHTINSVHAIAGHRVCHVLVGPIANLLPIKDECPWISLLDEPPDPGIYHALNHAISVFASRYNYFAYINDDDFWLPGFSRLFDCLDANPGVDLCYGRTVFTNNFTPCRNGAFFPYPRFFRQLLKFNIPMFTQQSILVRMATVLNAGSFDASYPLSADTQLWLKILASGVLARGINCFASCYEIGGKRLSLDMSLQGSAMERDRFDNRFPKSCRLSDYLIMFYYRLYNFPAYINRFTGRPNSVTQ